MVPHMLASTPPPQISMLTTQPANPPTFEKRSSTTLKFGEGRGRRHPKPKSRTLRCVGCRRTKRTTLVKCWLNYSVKCMPVFFFVSHPRHHTTTYKFRRHSRQFSSKLNSHLGPHTSKHDGAPEAAPTATMAIPPNPVVLTLAHAKRRWPQFLWPRLHAWLAVA